MPPVSTASFDRVIFPPEVLAQVWLTVLSGSPFAQALTPLPTSSGSVAFPKAGPVGAGWVKELDPLPAVNLNDSADVIAACKLAGLIQLSNESLDDASIPIGDLVGQAIRDAMGPVMDNGLLHGDGTPPNPNGILAKAPATAAGADLRSAVITAAGELAAAGAMAASIVAFVHPTVVATEWGRADSQGRPIHADSPSGVLTLGPGIPLVGVPQLGESPADVLVADVSQVYLVQRDAFNIETDQGFGAGFGNDAMQLRVKARVNVNAPAPAKSLRLTSITGSTTTRSEAEK